jgi:hypothetical protein
MAADPLDLHLSDEQVALLERSHALARDVLLPLAGPGARQHGGGDRLRPATARVVGRGGRGA